MRVSKFSKLGLPQLQKRITLCLDLRLRWHLNHSCILCQELSNGMWHATCMQRNQDDSRLLMVGNQIGNLILRPSFSYNLCFKYPNGSYELIWDIYVPRAFQWYKKFFNEFKPLKLFSENLGVHQDSNSQSGSSFGSVEVHSITLSDTLGSMKCYSRASHLACTFASPCLGHEPKVRVVTLVVLKNAKIIIASQTFKCDTLNCFWVSNEWHVHFCSLNYFPCVGI